MLVRLKEDWLENKKGSVIGLPPPIANLLVNELMIAEVPTESLENKEITEPPENKMMKKQKTKSIVEDDVIRD